jgi:valyl-tRNA synthetase
MNLEGRTLQPLDSIELNDVDRWIYHRLNESARDVGESMALYRLNEAAQTTYEFFWNDFCDWYVEATKLSLYSDDEAEKNRAITLLIDVLEQGLKLLHPFMSFLTEEIYQKLPAIPGRERASALIAERYPEPDDSRSDPRGAVSFASLQEAVRLVRGLRSEFTIAPSREIEFSLVAGEGFAHAEYFRRHESLIRSLTTASRVDLSGETADRTGSVTVVGTGYQLYVYVRDLIDVKAETDKLTRNIAKTEKLLAATEKKLSSDGFLSNASSDVVDKEKAKQQEFSEKLQRMRDYLSQLQ